MRLKKKFDRSGMLLKSRHAQSQVISTVILILLVISAGAIIFAFAIPFIQKSLSGGDCIEIVGKVEIKSSYEYTCYDSTSENMSLQIQIEDISDLLEGFSIRFGGASSKTIEITNESHANNETFMHGDDAFSLPGDNEARTYLIPSPDRPESVDILPILKGGKVCKRADSLSKADIDDC